MISTIQPSSSSSARRILRCLVLVQLILLQLSQAKHVRPSVKIDLSEHLPRILPKHHHQKKQPNNFLDASIDLNYRPLYFDEQILPYQLSERPHQAGHHIAERGEYNNHIRRNSTKHLLRRVERSQNVEGYGFEDMQSWSLCKYKVHTTNFQGMWGLQEVSCLNAGHKCHEKDPEYACIQAFTEVRMITSGISKKYPVACICASRNFTHTHSYPSKQ